MKIVPTLVACCAAATLAAQGGHQTVRVRGVDLSYVERGKGEPVLLLHGFLHDYRVWLENLATLSKEHRVIALSRRYRWPNQPPKEGFEFSAAHDLADVAAFIEQLKLGPAHLVGHSGGANLALRLAIERPDLVRSLVIGEAGAPGLSGRTDIAPPFTPAMRAEVRRLYEQGNREGALDLIAEAVLGKSNVGRSLKPEAGKIALDNLWQVERWWREPPAGAPDREPPFTCEGLGRLNVPVLLVGGERSPEFNKASLDGLQKCIRGAERVTIPTSHGLQLEDPDAFSRVVAQFLRKKQR